MPKVNSKKRRLSPNISQALTVLAFVVLGVLLTASYKLKDILRPNISLTAKLNDSCDLRKGSCTSDLPNGGKVSFSISPNDIQILKPLILRVEVKDVDVSNVEVDFIGVGMDMGFNRTKLTEVERMKFTGKGFLPVCARTRMDWEARVLLQINDDLVVAPFRFYTLK